VNALPPSGGVILVGKGHCPEIRGRGVGDGVVQKRAGVDGLFGDARVSLRLQIRVRQAEDVHQRRQPVGAPPPEGRVPGSEGNRAAGGNGILRDDVADFKRVRARERNHQRNGRVGLDRVQQIRAASAPAGGRRLVGNGGLPLRLLVGVRKKLRRLGRPVPARYCARVIGINQRAGVEQKRQLALAKKRLQFRATRMQAVSVAVAGSSEVTGRMALCGIASTGVRMAA
jgi:hypothetical protein